MRILVTGAGVIGCHTARLIAEQGHDVVLVDVAPNMQAVASIVDTGKVPLVHDGEEGGIVLSGRLEVTVDDERRILGPGDAYYFESRRPHRFRCVGPAPCEVISACTPPTF